MNNKELTYLKKYEEQKGIESRNNYSGRRGK